MGNLRSRGVVLVQWRWVLVACIRVLNPGISRSDESDNSSCLFRVNHVGSAMPVQGRLTPAIAEALSGIAVSRSGPRAVLRDHAN